MIVQIYHMIMLFHSLSLINERSSIMSIIVFVLSERDGKSNGSFSELCHAIVFLISTPRFLCLVLPSSDLLPIFAQTPGISGKFCPTFTLVKKQFSPKLATASRHVSRESIGFCFWDEKMGECLETTRWGIERRRLLKRRLLASSRGPK